MDSNQSPAQADPHHGGDVVLVAPKDRTDAEDALSVTSNQRRSTAGADFSAGPRMTELSLDPTLGPADMSNDPLPTDRPSLGRRTSRSLTRFLVAACVGVAATLAWQSYAGTAKQMIANSAPRLSRLLMSPPAKNPPSGQEIAIEQPSPPAVEASAPQAASAQAGAVASTASETATSSAPTAASGELKQQLETMKQDLAAVRQSVEQLAAGQEQMAREIAKLHGVGQDIRRRTAFPPAPAITAHKPVPPPLPAPQSSAAPLTPPPEVAPQSSAAPLPPAQPEPPRPPMPVR
jgi:hypothetical protein